MEEKKKSESLKEYYKEYYKRNREKLIKRATEYNKTHRDRVRETSREYERRKVEKLKQLEEENKKLKSDLAFERNMLDNVRAEYKSLQNIIKELKVYRPTGKFIELLNEYEKTLEPNEQIKWTENGVKATPLLIISKKYGFIKWLVENDKIDFSLIPNKIKEIGIPMKINGEIKYGFDSSDYYWLLMLLSISDTPIEDLISYLK